MPIFGKILGQPLPYLIMPGAVGWLNKAASAPSIDGSHVILQIDKWHGVLARPLPHVIFKIEK